MNRHLVKFISGLSNKSRPNSFSSPKYLDAEGVLFDIGSTVRKREELANLKSSKKDIRRSEKRNKENSQKRNALRTFSRNILKSLKAGKKEEATKLFSQYASLLDKAAKKNIVHKKTADRNKSRLSIKINSIK